MTLLRRTKTLVAHHRTRTAIGVAQDQALLGGFDAASAGVQDAVAPRTQESQLLPPWADVIPRVTQAC